MALVFIPKVIFIRQHAHDPREKEDDERETAEQELRYRELLKANEELQRKVAEVSFKFYRIYTLLKYRPRANNTRTQTTLCGSDK